MRVRFLSLVALVVTGAAVLGAAPSYASGDQSAEQTINVTRPAGSVSITDVVIDANGVLYATVIDTRDSDPGWSVTIGGATPSVVDDTPAFTDADGRMYDQQVTAGSAPRGHGLGIAHLAAVLPPGTDHITITVV